MNKEHKLRNEEVGRTPEMPEALSVAVGFSQWIRSNSSSGLQPHIVKNVAKADFPVLHSVRQLKLTAIKKIK